MCPSVFCRLCLCSSTEVKNFVDENGQYNDIYEITAKYFDPMLLTTVICVDCWQHIHEFYEFQQSVLRSQAKLHDDEKNEPLVKLEMVLIDQDNNDGDDDDNLKEDINILAFDTFDLKDSNPFSSDDEIPLAEYSKQKVCDFEELKIKEDTKKNIKKLNNTLYQNSKEETVDSDYHDGGSQIAAEQVNNTTENAPYDSCKEEEEDAAESDDGSTADERKFKCSVCNKKYKYARGLHEHAATHNGQIYQCPYCPAKFKIKNSIRRHIKKSHPKELVEFCDSKSKEETIKTDLEDDRKFKCTICDSKYKHVYGLREHMRIKHTEPTLFQCPHCPKEFQTKKNIPRHIQRFHPKEFVEMKEKVDLNKSPPKCQNYDAFIAEWKQELECDLCKNTFFNFSLLSQHFKDEHPNNYCHVVCCEYKISSRNKLVDHIRLHLNPNAFKCKICGKCLANSQYLKLHIQAHSEEKPFQCQVCQKRFRTKSVYILHSGTHTTEKNLICTVCGRGFSTKHLLKKHDYNSHRYFKARHLCEQCGKSCYSAFNLKEHILEHAGIEKLKWPCDVCGAKFKTRFSLKRHKKTFHNNMSLTIYECSDCGKISSNKFNLYLHKKNVHGVERKFSSVKSISRQKTTHSGEARFQCPHCPVKFKHRKNIRRHVNILHPNVVTVMDPVKIENTD